MLVSKQPKDTSRVNKNNVIHTIKEPLPDVPQQAEKRFSRIYRVQHHTLETRQVNNQLINL